MDNDLEVICSRMTRKELDEHKKYKEENTGDYNPRKDLPDRIERAIENFQKPQKNMKKNRRKMKFGEIKERCSENDINYDNKNELSENEEINKINDNFSNDENNNNNDDDNKNKNDKNNINKKKNNDKNDNNNSNNYYNTNFISNDENIIINNNNNNIIDEKVNCDNNDNNNNINKNENDNNNNNLISQSNKKKNKHGKNKNKNKFRPITNQNYNFWKLEEEPKNKSVVDCKSLFLGEKDQDEEIWKFLEKPSDEKFGAVKYCSNCKQRGHVRQNCLQENDIFIRD